MLSLAQAMRCAALAAGIAFTLPAGGFCADAPDSQALEQLPVRELTVFKDGHAFVLRSGSMPTDGDGNVQLDRLPHPVVGAFWAYASGGAKVESVVSGRQKVSVSRTALNLKDLLRANVGKEAIVTVASGKGVAGQAEYEKIRGTIAGFPARSIAEQEASDPADEQADAAMIGEIVLLKTADGSRALPVSRVLDASIIDPIADKVPDEAWRDRMTLRLEGAPKDGRAEVGMAYLQRGLRWIPDYRVTLDGKGTATVELQATLVNELVDLNDVKMQLAVGVPTFQFKDEADPIGLRQAIARVAANAPNDSQFMNMSNAVMSQQADSPPVPQESAEANSLGPQFGGEGRTEDLFFFTLPRVSLKKGERMAVALAKYTIPYEDIYTVTIPFSAPAELSGEIDSEQQRQMAKLLSKPRVMHAARLDNKSSFPLTTAPAMLIEGERPLGQGLMTYTPAGGKVDLPITTAVDVQVSKEEEETGRLPNAIRIDGSQLTRINLKGKISIANFRKTAVRLEIKRYLLGVLDSAGSEGKMTNGNVFDEEMLLDAAGEGSVWSRFSWPGWWSSANGLARATWTLNIEAGKTADVDYAWHYFSR